MCDKHSWTERARSERVDTTQTMETGLLLECLDCGTLEMFSMPGRVVPVPSLLRVGHVPAGMTQATLSGPIALGGPQRGPA